MLAFLRRVFKSDDEFKYGLLLCAVVFFLIMALTPAPDSLVRMVDTPFPRGYQTGGDATTITENVSRVMGVTLTPEEVAYKGKIMVTILLTAAFLWATLAVPLGATDLLVGGLMYLFMILPFDSISKAYMKDAVFFIFGVLAIAVGVHKTGLDRRIAILLLSRVRSLRMFCFLFFPAMALISGFFSAHALTAILVPVLIRVYRSVCDYYDVKSDRPLAVLLVLGLCFACNQGGPASPAAGGRNAIMVGYFKDYGVPISFGEWMFYAMPYVLAVSLVISAYMYFIFRRKITVPAVDFRVFMKQELAEAGKMSRREITMALILGITVVLWLTASKQFGLGGPCILAVILMLSFRVLTWQDVQTRVRFDVVGLYAAACAIGVGLKMTGASLWMANGIIESLPASLRQSEMLVISISTVTTVLTNFMSDGATVAALGPVTLSLGQVADIHLWKVGLACAFSSSFANVTIVGTPNNAIAYVGAVDPKTGERLLHLRDFLIYGLPVTLIAWLMLCTCAVWGYWRWVPWG